MRLTCLHAFTPWNSIILRKKKECDSYDDMVQINLANHYRNPTLKSIVLVQRVMDWRQNGGKLLIKADDKTFVNMALLSENVKNFGNGKRYGRYPNN